MRCCQCSACRKLMKVVASEVVAQKGHHYK
jgi:hypothetical protein